MLKAAGKRVVFMVDGNIDRYAGDVFACGADGIITEPHTNFKMLAGRHVPAADEHQFGEVFSQLGCGHERPGEERGSGEEHDRVADQPEAARQPRVLDMYPDRGRLFPCQFVVDCGRVQGTVEQQVCAEHVNQEPVAEGRVSGRQVMDESEGLRSATAGEHCLGATVVPVPAPLGFEHERSDSTGPVQRAVPLFEVRGGPSQPEDDVRSLAYVEARTEQRVGAGLEPFERAFRVEPPEPAVIPGLVDDLQQGLGMRVSPFKLIRRLQGFGPAPEPAEAPQQPGPGFQFVALLPHFGIAGSRRFNLTRTQHGLSDTLEPVGRSRLDWCPVHDDNF